jgi:hypothetical protein
MIILIKVDLAKIEFLSFYMLSFKAGSYISFAFLRASRAACLYLFSDSHQGQVFKLAMN